MKSFELHFAKTLVILNGAVPLALLGWDAAHHDLGANPIELVTRALGTMALLFLTLTLAITPVRQLFELPWLTKFRRMLGLYAFAYATLHLFTYLWLDQFFDLRAIATDAVTRPFITFGLLAYGFMLPLAWTSTNRAIKRLGKRWAPLHRRVYLVAVLAVAHYWLEVKADLTKPIIFALVIGALLFYRFVQRKAPARLG